MNFVIHVCLTHLVKYVAHHSIRFGLNFSLVGRNVLYCSRRYGFDVSDARSKVTEAQLHEVDLLFECVLITQCKGVTCHPFKTVKIIVFDPMKY